MKKITLSSLPLPVTRIIDTFRLPRIHIELDTLDKGGDSGDTNYASSSIVVLDTDVSATDHDSSSKEKNKPISSILVSRKMTNAIEEASLLGTLSLIQCKVSTSEQRDTLTDAWNSLRSSDITHLDLSNNKDQADAMLPNSFDILHHLTNGFNGNSFNAILDLNMSHNALGGDSEFYALMQIFQSGTFPLLINLDLSRNHLNLEGFKEVQNLSNPRFLENLHSLNLSKNDLKDGETQFIINMAVRGGFAHLELLNVSGNNMSIEDLAAFAPACTEASVFKLLHVSSRGNNPNRQLSLGSPKEEEAEESQSDAPEYNTISESAASAAIKESPSSLPPYINDITTSSLTIEKIYTDVLPLLLGIAIEPE